MPSEAYLINAFGTTIALFGMLVAYLATKNEYARPADFTQ